MTIEVICNSCGEETSLCGFLVNDDLKGTPFEYLLAVKDFNIQKWSEHMLEIGRAQKVGGIFIIDGIPIYDQMQRFEKTGKCPECGSTDCKWF